MMLSKVLQAKLDRWFRFSLFQQIGLFFVVFGLLLMFPLSNYWQVRQTLNQFVLEEKAQKQALQHQKHILASLERNNLCQLMPLDVAHRLTEINQFLEVQLAHLPEQATQWTFQPFPQLVLHFKSDFEQCQAFFTQLLTQYPQLFLLSLQIMKNEEGEESTIQTEVSFQLQLKQDS